MKLEKKSAPISDLDFHLSLEYLATENSIYFLKFDFRFIIRNFNFVFLKNFFVKYFTGNFSVDFQKNFNYFFLVNQKNFLNFIKRFILEC